MIRRPVTFIAWIVGAAGTAFTTAALAHPMVTPHAHNSTTVKWEYGGLDSPYGDVAHNHRSSHSFGGYQQTTVEPYSATACWDNHLYQYQQLMTFQKGHCFINGSPSTNRPTYKFVGSWPADLRQRVVDAFAAYGAVTSDSANRTIGVGFVEVTSGADISIYYDNAFPADAGTWVPSDRTLHFNEALPWNPNVNFNGVPDTQYHFLSVALHEIGHAHGFQHQDEPCELMSGSGGVGAPSENPNHCYFTGLDSGAMQGIRDLYSQSLFAPPAKPATLTTVLSCDDIYDATWPSSSGADQYELKTNFVQVISDVVGVTRCLSDERKCVLQVAQNEAWYVWVRACNCSVTSCCSGWRERTQGFGGYPIEDNNICP